MRAKDCPQWNTCSAGYCPFGGGGHIKGDPICYYLREFFKKNAKANFTNAGVGYIYEELEPLAPGIIASSRLIRKEVEKASKTNSRLAQCGKKKRVKAVDGEELKGEVYGTV